MSNRQTIERTPARTRRPLPRLLLALGALLALLAAGLPATRAAEVTPATSPDDESMVAGEKAVTRAADDPVGIALDHLEADKAGFGVTKADLADLVVASAYRSAHNGVTHVNVNQRHEGLEVFGAYATVNVSSDGEVLFVGDSLVKGLAVGASGASDIDVLEAVEAAADALDLDEPKNLRVLSRRAGAARQTVASDGGISDEPIPARLGWQPTDDGLRLAWQMVIDDTSDSHLWNATVDAESGELLRVDDWTSEDSVEGLASALARPGHTSSQVSSTPAPNLAALSSPDPVDDGSGYRVFALPKESPNDGPRTLVTNPADATGSPFGWHDTDGASGPEFTITRGNNAHAYQDQDDNNAADFGDADGGPGLDFDFPADLTEHAQNYRDAVTTNLFYTNNVFHDVMWRYGFDEASGNFQANNYGRGGTQGDYVRAEAADGGRTNNANFSTPGVDGGVPRMQMYLWPGAQFGAPNQVVVDGVGSFDSSWARFSPAPTVAGTPGEVINAGTGCASADYAGAPAGDWIAIVTGSNLGCQNFEKARQASAAGAGALIVAVNAGGAAPILTGPMTTAPPTIPVASITQADGNAIRAAIAAGPTTANVRKHPDHPGIRDGDLENGIIIHEYSHGVSNRLTGGPTVNCLFEQEQMGEGWSDYFAITMLLDPALDDPERTRGMGPYALFQDDRHGAGIRPAPYSRNMEIQPATYDSIKGAGWFEGATLSRPHGIGHVWAAMLWDMTWDLIDKHGFNSNVYDPWDTGGNNLALQLVIDGLKFQGCEPGFVVARDAIIAADEALTGGENACTLWASFARRGLGYSAVQGTSASRNDNDEAFDTHPECRAGFFGRVSEQPNLNDVNGGATMPLVFSLGGGHGLDIFASNSPYSRQVDCATLKTVDPESQFITPRPLPVATQAPGNSGLSYDPGEDRYTYPWRTAKEWAGTCRELVLTRTDGLQHRAFFRFGPSTSEPPTEPPISLRWEARYNGAGNGDDFARAMAMSAEGARVFVTGESLGGEAGYDFATLAYDAVSGEELWSARYDGPAHSDDVAHAVAVSVGGSRVYVTGLSLASDTGTDADYATVAYDAATGEEVWVARYAGPGQGIDGAFALGVGRDGESLFVTGQSEGAGTGRDYATVAYDADTGEELWAARYDGPAHGVDFTTALGVSADGSRVFVTGGSAGVGTSFDHATVAYDATTGEELWVARYDGPAGAFDFADVLAVSADGSRVFVTGRSQGVGTSGDYTTVAYDAATGEELWVARYDGPADALDFAQSIGVGADGSRVFVTGGSAGVDTGDDYATVAYDAATGEELWVARYDGSPSGADVAESLGVSADGSRLFVTGRSLGVGTDLDYTTVAYDAVTGEQSWVARYDGPARDADTALALGVSADGSRVFVTGGSPGTGTGADYATLAYDIAAAGG